MADVMMAESSSALTRRQHLAKTFESYRAELDADVGIYSATEYDGNDGLTSVD